MATLTQIVDSLAARVDKPFDVNLKEELKHIVGYKRSNYTQQFIDKHPEQRYLFQQKFTAYLEKAPTDDCTPVAGCVVLRTKCEIPKPVRNSYAAFDFVGDSNFVNGYKNEEPGFIQDIKYNRFTKKKPVWFYMNNRIYIYHTTVINRIGIRGVFEKPESITTCACEGPVCYNADTEYPMADDLLNAIVRDILSVELRALVPPANEVAVDKLEEMQTLGRKG